MRGNVQLQAAGYLLCYVRFMITIIVHRLCAVDHGASYSPFSRSTSHCIALHMIRHCRLECLIRVPYKKNGIHEAKTTAEIAAITPNALRYPDFAIHGLV